jgi:hypothetical protein
VCCDGVLSTFSPKTERNMVPLTCVLSSPSVCRLSQLVLSSPSVCRLSQLVLSSPSVCRLSQFVLSSPSVCRLSQFHLSFPPCSERQAPHSRFTGRSFAGAATVAPTVSGPPVGDLRPRRTQFLLRQLREDERVCTGVAARQQHGQSSLFEGAHSNRLPPFLSL